MRDPDTDHLLMPYNGLGDITLPKRYAVFYRREGNFATIVKLVDYVFLGHIAAEDLEDAFCRMQGENWSPMGEARQTIFAHGIHHTSMSVGDILYDMDTTEHHLVLGCGFEAVQPLDD